MRTVTKRTTTASTSAKTVIFTAETQEVFNWSYLFGVEAAADVGTMAVIAELVFPDGTKVDYDISASFSGDPTNTYGTTMTTPQQIVKVFDGKVAATRLRFEYTPTTGPVAAVVDFAYSAKTM